MLVLFSPRIPKFFIRFKMEIIFLLIYLCFILTLNLLPNRDSKLIIHFLTANLNLDNMSTLMHNLGLGFLTLLISLAIFVFSKDNKTILEWDKEVLFKEVINIKYLIVSLIAIFIPAFFFRGKINTVHMAYLFIFVYGLVIFCKILWNLYQWIKVTELERVDKSLSCVNYRSLCRNKYLGSLNKPSEIEQIWSITWIEEINSIIDQKNLLYHFKEHLKKLLLSSQIEDIKIFCNCVENFSKYIVKINTNYDDVLVHNIFEILLGSCTKAPDTNNGPIFYISIQNSIKNFCLYFIARNNAGLLTQYLKDYFMNEDVRSHDKFQSILNFIFTILFDLTLRADIEFDIWKDFPNELKLTSADIRKNRISRYIMHVFKQWIPRRWYDHFDKFESMVEAFFPEADPNWLGKIFNLIFLTRWSTEKKMEAVLESLASNKIYEFSSRIYINTEPVNDEINYEKLKGKEKQFKDQQEQNTLELALCLFENDLSEHNLQNYITELKGLKYPKDSYKKRLRDEYIHIFEELLRLPLPHPHQ